MNGKKKGGPPSLFIKWPGGLSSPCGFSAGGALYIVFFVSVPRGIRKKGEKKAREVLVRGFPPKRWQDYLTKEGAIIVYREDPPAESMMLELKGGDLK